MASYKTTALKGAAVKNSLLGYVIIALLGILFIFVSVPVMIFTEVCILIGSGITLLMFTANTFTLNFEGRTLTVTNQSGRVFFRFDDLKYEDFIFTRTAKQTAANEGHIKIRNYNNCTFEISEFSALKEYVETQYKG